MKKLFLILSCLICSITYAQQIPNVWAPTSGTDTYTVGVSYFGNNYTNKVAIVRFTNTNTGAATININGLGAVALRKWDGSAWVTLSAGDIDVTTIYKIAYNTSGTYFQMESFGSGGGGSATHVKTETGSSYTPTDADNNYIIILTDSGPIDITLDDVISNETIITFVRDTGAGLVTFLSDGTSVLQSAGSEVTLEADETWATWTKVNATDFKGVGQLGPGGGGGSVTDVTGTTNRITSTGGTTPQIDISTSYAGQSSITNVGTLTSGATGVGFTIALGTSTVTGLGTGVLTALGVNVGSAGSVVVNGGALGTPSSGVATNLTGTASGLTAGTVTTNANLTGHVTSTGNAAVLGSFSSSNLATALTDEVGTGSAVFSEPDANTQTGSYTLVLADKAKEVRMNVAGANNLTVPPNSSVAFPVGSFVTISQYGAGLTSVVAGSGVTIRTSAGNLLSPGQYSPMVLRKVATDEWYLWNGAAATSSAALTSSNTYMTTTIGGTPGSALLAAASVGVKFTGITGSVGTGDLVQATGTDTWSTLASVSAGSYLRSAGTSTASVWSTLKLPNSATANRIAYATSSNTIGESANLTYNGTTFAVSGGIQLAYAAKTTTYTITLADRFIECTSGSFTVTLPTAVGCAGYTVTIDNSGAGTITLATTSSQTIDGASPGTLTAGQKTTLYSNGSNWRSY